MALGPKVLGLCYTFMERKIEAIIKIKNSKDTHVFMTYCPKNSFGLNSMVLQDFKIVQRKKILRIMRNKMHMLEF